MTIEQAYNDFLGSINNVYEKREAENITDWIFENVTNLKRLERNADKNVELNFAQEEKLKKYLEEIKNHKPVQYVLQEAWFYKKKFFVNEHVLIPRPETEELVNWIVNDTQTSEHENHPRKLQILDIGTGSGCIAISINKELKHANVFAIDVSDDALKVAQRNANNLDANINFSRINFLDKKEWESLNMFDIIVSNPPYIPKVEKEKLAKNVTDFEPGIALFVPDNDPFIFYKKISVFAKSHLKTDGKIYVEVHEDYAKKIKDIFEESGFISVIKSDIYGKERMVSAVNPVT